MKLRSSLIFSSLFFTLLNASDQFWNDAHLSGPVVGGGGNWDIATANWASDLIGSTYAVWGGDSAIFTGTAGTVRLVDTVSFNKIDFKVTDYIVVASGASVLNANAFASITVEPNLSATIGANITCAGDLSKQGSGLLNFSGSATLPSANTLFIDEGSLLATGSITGGKNTLVGNSTNNNVLTLSGPTAVLTNHGTGAIQSIGVGVSGSYNTLSILNGAQAVSLDASSTLGGTVIGALVGSSHNALYVSGAGSMLTDHRVFYVGSQGNDNTLSITNGGRVLTDTGDFVVGSQVGASGNGVFIDGLNSRLDVQNGRTYILGDAGSNNVTRISNGGVLFTSKNGRIGNQANANNNAMTVTGAGSFWEIVGAPSTTGTLRVGAGGSYNTLSIEKGGAVSVLTRVFIGHDAGANHNAILVTGAGSSLSVPGPDTSANLVVGNLGTDNTLTVADGGHVSAGVGTSVASLNGSSGTIFVGRGGAPGTIDTPFIIGGSFSEAGLANLVFDHNSSHYVFSPLLIGALNIQQIGSGRTILSGGSFSLSGNTTVVNGVLQGGAEDVFSPLSPVDVLGGTFSLGGFDQSTASFTNMGLLTFGGNGLTLTVNGDFVQTFSGTYETEINRAGLSDLMSVTGSASLNGTLLVVPNSGVSLRTNYHLIHADGPVTGKFRRVVLENPLVKGRVVYKLHDVYLSLRQNLKAAAKTCNECAVASDLDRIIHPSGDKLNVLDTLVNLSVDGARRALNEIAGEQYTYLVELSRFQFERFNHTVFNALRGTILPSACLNSCSLYFWSQVEGGQCFAKSDCNSLGLKGRDIDVSFGAYQPFWNGGVVGLAVNYQNDSISFDRPGHLRWNTVKGSVHGTLRNSWGYLFGDLMAGGSWGHLERKLAFGSIKRCATSDPVTVEGVFTVEAGVNWCGSTTLYQPFFAVEFGVIDRTEVSECGADSLDLIVRGRCLGTVDTYLGTHATSNWKCLTLNLDLAWQHRLNEMSRIEVAFREFGDTFEIRGVDFGRNALWGCVNGSSDLTERATVYGNVQGEWWRRWASYSAALGLIVRW